MTPKRRRWLRALLWAAAIFLLWLALHDIDWHAVQDVLARLTGWEIMVLVLANTVIVVLLGARWWLILRAQGHPLRLLDAAAYRLAAFSVSYFTPGPHFGGEPLQVYLAVRRHKIPPEAVTASVVLDKALELLSNFAFLGIGIGYLFRSNLLPVSAGYWGLGAAGLLFSLPLSYLVLITGSKKPFTSLVARLPWSKDGPIGRLVVLAEASEAEVGRFIRSHRGTFLGAVILSVAIWTALLGEYALALSYLGMPLHLGAVIGIMAAGRIAILLPIPAGLGALEAALVLVTSALGEGAAVGAGLSVFIRVRDLSFGMFGLWLGRRLAAEPHFKTEQTAGNERPS